MRSGSDLDRNGVHQQNYGIYLSLLHDSLNAKQMFYMISLSSEFHSLRISRDHEQELNQLKNYSNCFPKGKELNPQMVKVIFLLNAHLDRVELSSSLQKDQEKILETTFKILKSILDCVLMLNYMQKGKKIGINVLETILDFNRKLVLGVPLQTPFLAMIPELKDYKNFSRCFTVAQAKSTLEASKNSLRLSAEEIERIKTRLDTFPEYLADFSIGVDGEEDIRMGDIASIKFKVTVKPPNGLEKSSDRGFNKKETVWVAIGDSRRVIYLKSFDNFSDTIEDNTLKIPIDRNLGFTTGKHQLTLEIKSATYMGVDSTCYCEFTVLNPLKTKISNKK